MHTPEHMVYVPAKEYAKGRINHDISAMKDLFARELTPELAESYIGSLKAHIGSAYDSYESFVDKGKEVHKALGKDMYGPVIVGFLQWAERKLRQQGVKEGPVHFALRDAWPFYTAAHVLWDGSSSYHPVGTYINRPLLSIEDEIAPEKANVNGFVAEYLGKSGIADVGKPVALIDSGAWGTVVRSIKETYLPHTPFYPMFWYSHNPHVAGFINEVIVEAGLPSEFGEVLNDSLECVFPQQYKRPISFVSDGSSRTLSLEHSDALSVAWGEAALEGVAEAARSHKGGIGQDEVVGAVQKLYALSQQAQATGEWTGVLPTHTPTWSKGETFLARWPVDVLP